jgi:Spy/CpxP family protein refolding chaperone
MKKHIVAIALLAGLTTATAASANWGRGGHGYGDDCYWLQMDGPMMQEQMMHQSDSATREKISKFFKDNQVLHKQLVMKQAEKRAIMQSEKPDPQAAATVAGELFDLRTDMHDKAEAAGVSQYLGPMGGGKRGHGPGAGLSGGPGMGRNAPKK